MTKYIPMYDDGRRKIIEYNTDNGFEVYTHGWGKSIFIYHHSVIVSEAYDTLKAAVRAWGEWSSLPVMLPDGSTIVPSEYLHPGYIESPFQMWNPGVVELWPGEVGYAH